MYNQTQAAREVCSAVCVCVCVCVLARSCPGGQGHGVRITPHCPHTRRARGLPAPLGELVEIITRCRLHSPVMLPDNCRPGGSSTDLQTGPTHEGGVGWGGGGGG